MNTLYLKHRLAVSHWAASIHKLRHMATKLKQLRRPELALLREEEMMMHACLRRHLTHDAVCVDVGVHIGSITQVFRTAAPNGRHILVEASPFKAEWLRAAFPEYELHQVAVSDSEGEVSFFENLDNSGFSSLQDRASRGRINKITVKCTTLDLLLADAPRIDLMKVDVEGFEPAVFRGACKVLERHRPAIIFEAGAAADPDVDNEDYLQLFDLLSEKMGYEIRPIYGWFYDRAPITRTEFNACRTYPHLAFNFVGHPKG